MRKLLIITILIWNQAIGQNKELIIGDYLPEMDFENVVNYSKPIIESEELKNKIIIIDFWGTTCTSCISNMPKMAALQKEFKEDLVVILVTHQERALVEKFYTNRPQFKRLNLPVASGDSLLRERFPYVSIPQLVWIGKDRQVKAITRAEYATKENVRTLLGKNSIKLPLKHDVVNFDYYNYFPRTELATTEILRQSKLTGYIDGLSARQGFSRPDSEQLRIYATNLDVTNLLYQSLSYRFSPVVNEQRARLILETSRKDLFESYAHLEDLKKILYCYEVGMKGRDNATNRLKLSKKMQADVEYAFDISVTIEKRTVECYILKSIGEHPGNGEKKSEELIIDSIIYKNAPGKSIAAGELFYILKSDIPIVFEGKSTDRFSMTLAKKYADHTALNNTLNKAGLHLEKGKRELEMMVVKDK